MFTLKFMVQKDSTERPYQVTATKEEDNISIRCTCPHAKGIICPHVIALLMCKSESILSPEQNDFFKWKSWLRDSDVRLALTEFQKAMKHRAFIENKLECLTLELQKAEFDEQAARAKLLLAIHD